jgi:chromosomal replication initiator protein
VVDSSTTPEISSDLAAGLPGPGAPGEGGAVRVDIWEIGGPRPLVLGPENVLLAAMLTGLIPHATLRAATNVPRPSSHDGDVSEAGTRLAAEQTRLLILMGPSGVGKTAVSHAASSAHDKRRVGFFSAMEIGRLRSAAIREEALATWRTQWTDVDLLILEDIDRVPLSSAVQHELCLALDTLTLRSATIVVTSQREPGQWEGITAALRDRLSAGLTIPICPPGKPARRAILELAAQELGFTLSAAQLNELAGRLSVSPARLWGTVATMDASRFHQADHSDGIDISRVRSRKVVPEAPQESPSATASQSPTDPQRLRQLLGIAARYFGVPQSALTGPSRRKSLVHARGIAIHVARQITGLSYAQIGTVLGRRDHSTVLHADRRVAKLAQTDTATQIAIDDLRRIAGQSSESVVPIRPR